MSGPRVTSGEDSKQDYATPDDFMAAVTQRFGLICFDLAAHRGNNKHERYFAPPEFIVKYDPEDKKFDTAATIDSLVRRGAHKTEATSLILGAIGRCKKTTIKVPNHDTEAFHMDAFTQSWADISKRFKRLDDPRQNGHGLLWLNCEFSDTAPWAERYATESKLGANGLLLTPASIGSNWCRDHVDGQADVYELGGRLCFDGKNVFPKDCILSHFYPGARGDKFFWEWRTNKIWHTWRRAT